LDTNTYFYLLDGDTVDGKVEDHQIQNGKFIQFKRQFFQKGKINREPLLRHTLKKPKSLYKEINGKVEIDNTLFSGEFKNGKKIGEWIYYKKFSDHLSYCYQTYPTHYINYQEDTSIYISSTYTTKYANDSSIIFGRIKNHHLFMSFQYHCDTSNGCKYWNKRKPDEVYTSNFDDFEERLKYLKNTSDKTFLEELMEE